MRYEYDNLIEFKEDLFEVEEDYYSRIHAHKIIFMRAQHSRQELSSKDTFE